MLARLARGRGWLLPGVLTSCLKPCKSVQASCRACQLSQITNLLAQPFLLFVSVLGRHHGICSTCLLLQYLQLQNLVFIVAKPRSHLIAQKLWGEVRNTTAKKKETTTTKKKYHCILETESRL